MKRNFIVGFCIAAAGVSLAGCRREIKTERLADYTTVTAGSSTALVKVNWASAYARNPSVQLKLNDQRVSNAFTYPYPFPGGGLNTGGASDPLYFAVTPGSTKVSVSIPALNTANDSVALFSTTLNGTTAGKYYTFHIADTGANTQTVLIEENATLVDTGVTRFRFVNLMPNLPAADLYFGSVRVASNVAYKAASSYFVLPRTLAATVFLRVAGAAPTSTAITAYPSATTTFSVPNGRAMTIYARGYNGIAGTTDVRRPQLSLFYVQ